MMYQPTPAGEAYQINNVWYQDYNVQDTAGNVVVKRYMHNGTDWVEAPSKIDLAKGIPNTGAGINLKKNVINLDKCLINLSKASGIDMSIHCARVGCIIDYSGSMRTMFNDGSVQKALNRLVPLGLRFDDNGEIDVWLFNDDKKRIAGIGIHNFENYVAEVAMKSGFRFGGTSYSPVLVDAYNKYIKEEPDSKPAFLIFITDGSNNDKRNTNDIIKLSSEQNIFIQFVGIGGNDRFEYLHKLDDLGGRKVDNTGFIEVASFDRMSDDQLYQALLEQYLDWLKATGQR